MEVYTSDQVTTYNGSMEITISKGVGTGITQNYEGEVSSVSMAFTSGMVTSWNKFCFTGGYLEASVKMPGDDFTSGFWPAIWLLGNLGRAGYMASTQGFWPYSYDVCDAAAGMVDWSSLPGQRVPACADAPGFNRTRYGFAQGLGRGSPEIDLFEMSVPSSLDGVKGTAAAHSGAYTPPYVSQTLQMGPIQPPGTAFMTSGVSYPGADATFATKRNPWSGVYSRPGNTYQDSFSAVSYIDTSYFSTYHKFGLYWSPGSFLRWYIDDKAVFEITEAALAAVSNATGAGVGQRNIPVEAMYLVMNLGMSNDFTPVDLYNLPFPSTFNIDYVRVYQAPNAINVGCSPDAYPTQQWLACNRDKYIVRKQDKNRISGKCASGGSRALPGPVALLLGAVVLMFL
ncbi:hypothetical protein QBZ16_004662 [Prototheca wickerhamii]|uniref:GH16 domain-containing protein n=1 Tax=Prototheca wickerhamii TaxID=3111 RepID=A0AAD9IIN0_PROWI|nr:hypothetical protein QBZ16_004662 [Prototheca wickerhamii]